LVVKVMSEPRARTTDPVTSHDAAASVKRIRESHELLLAAFERWGDMTDTQLAECLARVGAMLSPSGIRSRRAELVEMGKLRDSGRTDILPSGRRSIVWRLV
jgi:hypothetical protein